MHIAKDIVKLYMKKQLITQIDKIINKIEKNIDHDREVVFLLHSLKVDIDICENKGGSYAVSKMVTR